MQLLSLIELNYRLLIDRFVRSLDGSIVKKKCNNYQLFSCIVLALSISHESNAAEYKKITFNGLPSTVHLVGQQKISLIATLQPNQFLVLFLTASGIVTKLNVQSPGGKPLAQGHFQDLYKRQRLFISGEQCTQCHIFISGEDKASSSGELYIEAAIYSSNENPIRLKAEKNLQRAFNYQIELPSNGFQNALSHYESAIEQWLKLSDRQELKNTYYLAGDAASGLSIHEKKPQLFTALAQLAIEDKDNYAAAIAYIRLGRSEYTQGRYQKAEAHFQHALYYAQKPQKASQSKGIQFYLLGKIEHELGQLATQRNQYSISDAHLKRALENFKKSADKKQQAAVLNTLGLLARRQNKLRLASRHHQRAYALVIHDDHGGFRMRTLYYMAVVNAIRGRYFYALELLERAESIASRLNTVHWQAHISAAQARINMELGRFSQSLSLYKRTRKLYQKVQAEGDLITVSLNLGKLYSKLGDFKKSRYNFEKALDSPHEKSSIEHRLNLLTAKVSSYIKQSEFSLALKTQEKILSLIQPNNDQFSMDRNFSQLAEIYLALNQDQKALDILQKVLNQQRNNQDDLSYTHSNYLAAKAASNLKRPTSEVLTYIDQAITTIENIRSTLFRDDLRQQYFALQKSFYELKTMLYLDPDNSSYYNPLLSLNSAESFKARTLYENLLKTNSLRPKTKISVLRHTVIEDKGENTFQYSPDTYSEETLLQSSFEDFTHPEKQINEKEAFPLNISQLNVYRQHLPPEKAVLYFFTAEHQSILWLLSKNDLKVVELPSTSVLNKYIQPLLEELATLPTAKLNREFWQQQHQLRQQLSKVLFNDVMPHIRPYSELLVIPDGPLHKVPFSALYDPDKQTPLLLNHTISYGVSIATQERLQQPSPAHYKPGALLLVANPQAEKTEALLSATTPALRSSVLRSLPYAEKEAEAVMRFWQEHGHIDSLLGNAATKQAIYRSPLAEYEVLHFATHAIVNWDYPSLSAISLTQDQQKKNSLESKDLTVQDISQWRINAELVILSGCDTASGKAALGEGPLGLSRAFFEAGSKRVIASIWPVEDEASAFLIENFYQELFINGHSPAEALRQARLSLSEIPRWSHPYYWAGFLFLGNGEHWREF